MKNPELQAEINTLKEALSFAQTDDEKAGLQSIIDELEAKEDEPEASTPEPAKTVKFKAGDIVKFGTGTVEIVKIGVKKATVKDHKGFVYQALIPLLTEASQQAVNDFLKATLNEKALLADKRYKPIIADEPEQSKEVVYVEYLNKAKNFAKDKKTFTGKNAYEDAVKWAKDNFEKFDRDMIKYETIIGHPKPEKVLSSTDKIKLINEWQFHNPKTGHMEFKENTPQYVLDIFDETIVNPAKGSDLANIIELAEKASAEYNQEPAERKLHVGDEVVDADGVGYDVFRELGYSKTHGDYQVSVKEANPTGGTLGKEFMFSEKSLTKLVRPAAPQPEYTFFKGTDFKYENLFVFNKAIEDLLTQKVVWETLKENNLREVTILDNNLTSEELIFVSGYVGYGGLEKFGAKGLGLLYEYYTPDEIVKMMWALAHKYKGDLSLDVVCEPSVATGRFFKYAHNSRKVGFEINMYSAVICKLLNPRSTIYNNYFEEQFVKNNASIKSNIYDLPKFNLVIGNPPYGDISQGASKWFAMGEDKYSKATNYIDYFIFRGLDLLVSGGLLIFIVGAEKHAGGNLFLEKGTNKTKQMIAEKADIIDAYKLPTKLFQTTNVSSEIIILRKK